DSRGSQSPGSGSYAQSSGSRQTRRQRFPTTHNSSRTGAANGSRSHSFDRHSFDRSETAMLISFERRPLTGFERWAEDRQPHCNDNDGPDHDNVGSMTDPDRDGTARVPSEPLHRPWHVPGIGMSL